MHRCRISHFARLAVMLLLIGILAPAGALAANAQTVIFEGSIDSDELSWGTDETGNRTLSYPDAKPILDTDWPRLPALDKVFLVPMGARIVGVEVVPLETHREQIHGALALNGKIANEFGDEARIEMLTAANNYFPSSWSVYSGTHVMRGYRLATLRIFPVRAIEDGNGNFNEIEILDRYAVRLVTGDTGSTIESIERARLVPGERARIEKSLRLVCANPEAINGYFRHDGAPVAEPRGAFQPSRSPSLSGSTVSYLIITNEEMAEQFQRFADFKTETGIPAVVATTDWIQANFRNGADIQETMRMFIQEAYVNWGIEYVLLGGDTDILPPRYVTSYFYPPNQSTDVPVDIYFSGLDGNWNADGDANFGEIIQGSGADDQSDYVSEIYVGRAAVSNSYDAQIFVDKNMTYQQTAAGSEWTNRNLMAAEILFYSSDGTVSTDGAEFAHAIVMDIIDPCSDMEYFRMYETDEFYPWDAALTRSALIDTLNNGRYGIVNQIGHGYFYHMSVADANFTSADADALTNGDHLFLMFAMNCGSGGYDQACLLERFMQNPNGGSVASVGASRATYPDIASMFEMDFYSTLYCDGIPELGIMMELGRLPYVSYVTTKNVYRWTYMTNMYLGDPSLALWTSSPQTTDIAIPASISAGDQLITATVTSGGSTIEGARVCLTMAGQDYAYGLTDATGSVTLPFTPATNGLATVTVTGDNLEYTQQIVTVTAGSSYVALANMDLDDTDGGARAGNGNQVLEAGETVELLAYVSNTGGGGASGCNATLTSSTPGIMITDGTAVIGTVGAGAESVPAQDVFLIETDAALVDGTTASFLFTVEDGTSTFFETEWTISVRAPELEPIKLAWTDNQYGNDNGILDNSERVDIQVTLKNFGVGLGDLIEARLRTADPTITLYDTIVNYSDIALIEENTGNAIFSMSQTDGTAQSPAWILFTDNYGRQFRHDFHLQYPETPVNLVTDPSHGADVIIVAWDPITEGGVRGYNIYHSLDEAGPFDRINIDLLESTSSFRDDGLELLTSYYYKVSAVSDGLVESAHSEIVMRSTSPAEVSGFPLSFGMETSSHCAVGDLDGDGHQEVVLAAEDLYVWTDDGGELYNGDGDGLTIGPFTNIEGQFEPAGVTLANIDGGNDLEIIASERAIANEIHIYKADGSMLTGWPQSLGSSWNWATPAVGDVDGDHEPEIVLTTVNGRTFVFNHDGTEMIDGDNNPGTHGVFCNVAGFWNYGSPALADLDGDGAKDVILGSKLTNNANFLYAFKHDGTSVAGFPYGGAIGRVICAPAVADLNDDGIWEIIFFDTNGMLYVVQADGTDYPGFPMQYDHSILVDAGTSPAVGNFDGDSDLEIVWAANVDADRSDMLVIDTDYNSGTSGTIMNGWPQLIPGSSEGSPVVGDIDGDGVQDILHGIGGFSMISPNNLYAFKTNGSPVAGFPITLNGPLRPSAVICDFDSDGDVDIVLGGGDQLLHVWDMPFAYNEANCPWPTFHGNAMRDGVCYGEAPVAVPDNLPTPDGMVVKGPYPNPFNPSTSITLFVPGLTGANEEVELNVYDVNGRRVRTLHTGAVSTGWHTWVWDGRDNSGRTQSSGIYFLRARCAGETAVHKMSLIK